MILLFDVGNSRIKAAWRLRGKLHRFAAFPLDRDPKAIIREMRAELDPPSKPEGAALATVNEPACEPLVAALAYETIPVLHFWKSDGELLRRGYLRAGVQTPQTTGVDRVLSSLGASRRTPGRPVIVIDCGSAVTVNFTSSEGVFQGGAIFPGLRLMTESLHQRTAALPLARAESSPPAIGRSTVGAIASGVYYALAGAIDRLVDEIAAAARFQPGVEKLKDTPEVYLTGGDSPLIGPALRTPHQATPHLVLEGLAATLEPPLYAPRQN